MKTWEMFLLYSVELANSTLYILIEFAILNKVQLNVAQSSNYTTEMKSKHIIEKLWDTLYAWLRKLYELRC